MAFNILQAQGMYVVVEPYEKSTILQDDSMCTVFKVISIGKDGEETYESNSITTLESSIRKITVRFGDLVIGDLIIVAQGSVNKTLMGSKEIMYVRNIDIIAKVIDG